MFWGLVLKPRRYYWQMTVKHFHISHAALEGDDRSSVYVTVDKRKYLLCTLDSDCRQVFLDLNFHSDEGVRFQIVGNGEVSLTGYIIEKFAPAKRCLKPTITEID